jgi:hypothetical protein
MSLNSKSKLIFIMEKCCVFFMLWTEFLNIISVTFGFERLNYTHACDVLSDPFSRLISNCIEVLRYGFRKPF